MKIDGYFKIIIKLVNRKMVIYIPFHEVRFFFYFTLCCFSFLYSSPLNFLDFSFVLQLPQFLFSSGSLSSIVNSLLTYLYKTRILQAHHRLACDNSIHHLLLLLLSSFFYILLLPLFFFPCLSFVPLLSYLHERLMWM